MDENYLDNLLNEFSLDKEIDDKIEDELDNQIAEEKVKHQRAGEKSRENLFNLDLEQDAAGGFMEQDMVFSEEQMDELDNLGNLADLDIGDLDFSDIDFDDLDMTKLDDIDTKDIEDLIKDFEGDLEIDDVFDDKGGEPGHTKTPDDTVSKENGDALEHKVDQQDNLNEDDFNADAFLDSLLEETDGEITEQEPITELQDSIDVVEDVKVRENIPEEEEGTLDDLLDTLVSEETDEDATDSPSGLEQTEENQNEPTGELSEEDALDDLFSLLDLDEENDSQQAQADSGDDISGLSDSVGLQDLGQPGDTLPEEAFDTPEKEGRKKKSFMEILFGEPDEDDILSEEEIAEIEAKKAEKKAKKQAAKEAKKEKAEAAKAEKELKNGKKKQENAEKQRVKAELKAKIRAEEAANAEPEKKLNRPAVIFIFSIFLGGAALFCLTAGNFNYTQAIQKATNYFESQKYHKAYDEIKGVEVKEKDQNLKDRIYTVMYVERLYESYSNNIQMGFYDKALDSLLRGVDKYYEHYDEAVELGIVDDIDYSFGRIQEALTSRFGISLEKALEINELENDQYVLTVRSYVEDNLESLVKDTQESNAPEKDTSGKEDAVVPGDVKVSDEQEEEVTQ